MRNSWFRPLTAASIVAAGLGTSACGGGGSYELTWTIGCDKLPADDCRVTRVRQCSAAGLDVVTVRAISVDSTVTRSRFACFSVELGPVGRGPRLPGGPTRLEVEGLSPGGQTVTGPVSRPVEVPVEGYAEVTVDLPLPPQCRDGIDNDGDGLVDLFDPDCVDEHDEDEAQ